MYVFGDSLSAKRRENVGIIEWPRLVASDYTVKNYSRPFLTTDVLENYKGLTGIAILNLGLVDCAERRFSQSEFKVLSLLPSKVRKVIMRHLRRKPNIERAFVSREKFVDNVTKFIDSNKKLSIYVFGILPGADTSALSQVTRSQINTYNSLLEKICEQKGCTFIATDHITSDDFFLADGYHLSERGHKKMANLVESINA